VEVRLIVPAVPAAGVLAAGDPPAVGGVPVHRVRRLGPPARHKFPPALAVRPDGGAAPRGRAGRPVGPRAGVRAATGAWRGVEIGREGKGDVGNSLLPYQQILVKAIFLALIQRKWSILVK
jgi:hypothetical protein